MSTDSSKPTLKLGNNSPVQKMKAGFLWRPPILRPHKQWGVIGGALFGFVALLAPVYLLTPVLGAILPWLPLTINSKLSLAETVVIAASFGLIAATIFAYGRRLADIGFTKITGDLAAKALGGFVVYFLASLVVADIAGHLFTYNHDQQQNLGFSNLGGFDLLLAFIPLVIITPLAEESIFRGFMFTGFRTRLPFWVSAVAVSALFGIAHGQVNVGLDVFVMSMVGCYLRETTKSLWPSIFLHALKNGVAFYLLYLYNGH